MAKKATKRTAKTGPSLAGTTTAKDEVERFRKAAEAYSKRVLRSRETARKALVELGIYTKSGKLTRHYSK